MLTVLLVIQIIITVAMVAVILIQRNASDGLAGLSGGGGNSLLSGRASANILTRTTAILAAIFMANSLLMGVITARSKNSVDSILETQQEAPAPSAPKADSDATPAANNNQPVEQKKFEKPAEPSVPKAE